MSGIRDDVQSEIDRALDTLGVPRIGPSGARLSQDERLSLWVRDPRAGRFTPSPAAPVLAPDLAG
jgi:hypothetical protein